jgi:acetyl-CoA C-acetyltransferase
MGADLIATLEGWGRADVDAFALRSHQRAAAAWAEGRFAKSVVPVQDIAGLVMLDRTTRPSAPTPSLEGLAKLDPSFAMMGRWASTPRRCASTPRWSASSTCTTPATASGIVDGAALMLVGTEEGRRQGGAEAARAHPRRRGDRQRAHHHADRPDAGLPQGAGQGRHGGQDIDLWEINEAFAVVPMKTARDLGVDLDRVNVNGGSIAMGHPLGATGCIILGTLLDELERRNLRTGLATLCVGGGMGIATIIERV